MAAGGSSFIRNFGVRLVVLEADSFTRANQQVVQANNAQEQSLRRLGNAQRQAAGTSNTLIRSLREMAASIAVIDGPLGGVASRFNAFATVLTATGGAALAMGAGVSAVFFVLSRAIPVVSQMQQSTLRLEGVMRATGGQIGLTETQLESFSRRLGLETLASVNEVRDALTEVAVSGVVFGDTATRLVTVSQDLAQVFGGTLDQNLSLLLRTIIKVESGVEGFRERFGVQIPDALERSIKAMQRLGDTQGSANAILDFISGRVAGAGAAAAAGTIAGAIDHVSQRWQEFLEIQATGPTEEVYVTFLNFLATKIHEINTFVTEIDAKGGWISLLLGPAESEVRLALAQIEALVGLIDDSLQKIEGIQGAVSRLQEGGLPGLVGRLRETVGEGFGVEELGDVFGDVSTQLGTKLREAITSGLEAAGLEESAATVQRVLQKFSELGGTGEQRVLRILTEELELGEEVGQAIADRLDREEQARRTSLETLRRQAEAEYERTQQVERAAAAAQEQLRIDAQRKAAAEAAEKAAKEAAQLEEQRNARQIQELLRIEGIIERLNAQRIEARGGTTFEKIEATESGTTAFLLFRDQIKFIADAIDADKRFEEQVKLTNEALERRAKIFQQQIEDQRAATLELAEAVSGELVGAWRSVTQAIIEGTDVAKAALGALVNSALRATEAIAGQLIASGIASGLNAVSPTFATSLSEFFTFAQGGQFNVGDRGGSSIVHMSQLPGPGIFAGRAQRGLDFMVPGSGAADTVPVSFLATPGERVTVSRPGAAADANINLNINAPGATAETVEMLRVYGEGLIEQAVGRSVGRMVDLATRDRTVRRAFGRRR